LKLLIEAALLPPLPHVVMRVEGVVAVLGLLEVLLLLAAALLGLLPSLWALVGHLNSELPS
jgi:hypothetical protein